MPNFLRTLAVSLALAAVAACGGGGGGDDGGTDDGGGTDVVAPSNLQYLLAQALYRVDEAIAANTATAQGDPVDTYTVDPALPAGLALNTTTGEITGTPTAESPTAQYTVTATNAGGSTTAQVSIDVGKQLPAVVTHLALGFVCEPVVEGLSVVTKIALTGDGRILFTEVGGRVATVPTTGGAATTIAMETVTTGGHHGLVGLALAPDFDTTGHFYLQFTEDAGGTVTPPFQSIVRWTDGTPATNRTEIIANLPTSPLQDINNGGELLFDQTGRLLISIGDVNVPANSQAPASGMGSSLAGKILRINPANPGDFSGNPNGDPEYARGLRNTFGIAIHPTQTPPVIIAVDNGPDMDDEINVVFPGDNFGWGNEVAATGFKIRNYQTVIVPTGLAWHNGAGFGAEYDDDLFMTSYDEHTVRRLEFLFSPGLALDTESVWAEFLDNAGQNHPMDVAIDPSTGDLYVATFSGIYRFSKQ